MKRALIVVAFIYGWTVVASGFFCAFNFRLFTFPYIQWWEGLYYLRTMMWLPRLNTIPSWPLLWFVLGFIIATLTAIAAGRYFIGSFVPTKGGQPNLYGESKFADIPTMKNGGIISEKRQ